MNKVYHIHVEGLRAPNMIDCLQVDSLSSISWVLLGLPKYSIKRVDVITLFAGMVIRSRAMNIVEAWDKIRESVH